MSETKEGRRPRETRGAEAGGRAGRSFVVAAQAETVVLVDTGSGRSWALGTDGGHPVWQPIAFKGQADKAPKGLTKDEE